MSQLTGFPPILGENPKVLILGSMPSQASLNQQQYYGHPRNAFWLIMESLFHVDAQAAYADRVEGLISNRIAVWDVIQHCQREGSLDSAIDQASLQINEFSQLFYRHPSIEKIGFNGGMAFDLFMRDVYPALDQLTVDGLNQKSRVKHPVNAPLIMTLRQPFERELLLYRLPSTSPANARLTIEDKVVLWRKSLL